MHPFESLINNRFYIVYDYNHYSIITYQQYPVTKRSISNFECPPFEYLYHCRGIAYLYAPIHHVDQYKLKFSVPHEQLLSVIHS